MTWYFDPSGTTYDAYAPDGSQAATDQPFRGTWSNAAPKSYYRMAVSYTLNNAPDTATGLAWIADLIAHDIETGTP